MEQARHRPEALDETLELPVLTKIVATLLLPPLNLLLLAVGGWLLGLRWPRLGRSLVVLSLISAYLMSTPAITRSWLRHLEGPPPQEGLLARLNDAAGEPAGAIVVLGGGSYFAAPEYGGDTVSDRTLVRLRWAAHVHRASGLPILVSGGSPYTNAAAEAQHMHETLKEDFTVSARWVETNSRNTRENALYARDILIAREHIRHIALVTDAWHMPRAQMVFEQAGFVVTPAPTAFTTRPPRTMLDFLPSASGLRMARTYLHEVIGIGWYHFLNTLDRK